jgi:hypothetical protein
LKRYLVRLDKLGWRHRCTVLPKPVPPINKSEVPRAWTVVDNGTRATVLTDEHIHVFLLEALLDDSGWAFLTGEEEKEAQRNSVSSVFVRRRSWRSPEAFHGMRYFAVNIVDSTGAPFFRPFTRAEAFVSLLDLRRLDEKVFKKVLSVFG